MTEIIDLKTEDRLRWRGVTYAVVLIERDNIDGPLRVEACRISEAKGDTLDDGRPCGCEE